MAKYCHPEFGCDCHKDAENSASALRLLGWAEFALDKGDITAALGLVGNARKALGG